MQAMREETEAMKKDPARAKPSEVRVRENLQNTLTRKFVDLAKDYQNRQVGGVGYAGHGCRARVFCFFGGVRGVVLHGEIRFAGKDWWGICT